MKEDVQKKYPLVIGAQAPVLRTVASPVGQITKEVRLFARDLLELMRQYGGVGLAAPQVGQSRRVFAYSQRDFSKKKRKLLEQGVMINPKIVYLAKETCLDNEGCLSLPGLEGEVERSVAVTMSYIDGTGKPQIKKATGYNARILLHELDHLDGILFIDKATKVWEKKGKEEQTRSC